MYVYVCMYVCMYVCICIYACIYLCTYFKTRQMHTLHVVRADIHIMNAAKERFEH